MTEKRGRGRPPKIDKVDEETNINDISKLNEDAIKKIKEDMDLYSLTFVGMPALIPDTIKKAGGISTPRAHGLPKQQSIYQAYNQWTEYQNNHLRIITENDSYLQAIYRVLVHEIFKGKINLVEAYGSKCPICDWTTDKEVEECPDCKERLDELGEKLGITPEPDEEERREQEDDQEQGIPQEEEPIPVLATNGGTAIAEPQDIGPPGIDDLEVDPVVQVTEDPKVRAEYDSLLAEIEENPIKHPDQGVKKLWETEFENLNDFGHSLEDILKLSDKFKHQIDNAAILAFKSYEFEESLSTDAAGYEGYKLVRSFINPKAVNKFMAINPDAVAFNTEENSEYIKQEYFCHCHRAKAIDKRSRDYTGFCQQKELGSNEICGKQLMRAYYKVLSTSERDAAGGVNLEVEYYHQKEIKHFSFYNATNTKGRSPVYSILALLEARFGMDIDLKLRYADRQYPDEVMIITGSNEDAFSKQMKMMHHQIQTGELPRMYNELRPGENGSRKPVELIKLRDDSITDLLNRDAREEIRNECNRIYGVVPLFTADVQRSSALSGEGQQIRVMSKTIEANQEQYHESIFPWIMECIGVDDWRLELNPPEEETEAHAEELKSIKLDNLKKWVDLGVDVKIEDYNEVEYTVTGDPKKQEAPSFGGVGGEGLDTFGPDSTIGPSEPDFTMTDADYKAFDDYMILEAWDGDWQLSFDELDKAFEQRSYADMSVELSQTINTEIKKGLQANAGFFDIVKNVEDLPQWQTYATRENPVLGKEEAIIAERGRLELIVRNEGTKVRKEKYRETMKKRDPENTFKYRWAGPPKGAHRNTDICNGILEEVAAKGGKVSMPEFESIMKTVVFDLVRANKLDSSAIKYMDVNSHQPHLRCRHKLVRTS